LLEENWLKRLRRYDALLFMIVRHQQEAAGQQAVSGAGTGRARYSPHRDRPGTEQHDGRSAMRAKLADLKEWFGIVPTETRPTTSPDDNVGCPDLTVNPGAVDPPPNASNLRGSTAD
jgi:hypothetical protein